MRSNECAHSAQSPFQKCAQFAHFAQQCPQMALLCGIKLVFLRKFSCWVSHVRNLRIYGKTMFQMSVLPCLTVRRITVPSSRSSQFLCICQVLSKSSGQIYSYHIGSKIVSCFCQIMSLCCWDTYKMCAKIWGAWTGISCVGVTQNRLVRGTDSWSILL